jgi:hypothetical protein
MKKCDLCYGKGEYTYIYSSPKPCGVGYNAEAVECKTPVIVSETHKCPKCDGKGVVL